jgi:hypothetical protein
MAKLHVLEGNPGSNSFTVVVHIATPAGNNSAGIAWSDALKNAGLNRTQMTEGVGPGLITTAEKQAIEAGTLIEGSFRWGDTPEWNNAQRQADLDLRATQLTNELLADYGQRLKYFGFTGN